MREHQELAQPLSSATMVVGSCCCKRGVLNSIDIESILHVFVIANVDAKAKYREVNPNITTEWRAEKAEFNGDIDIDGGACK